MKFVDIETLGLEPITHQIICVGLGNLENGTIQCFYGKDEEKLLTEFWDKVEDYEELVGFNSDGFDIPFLITRSLINNVKIKKTKSIDLRKVVSSFFTSYDKYAKGSLSDWAEVLEVEQHTISGKKMLQLFIDEKWPDVLKHNREDIELTKKLYERCKNCGLI